MTLLPQIEGFRILGLLGKGGMGFVYLAEDEELGRKVAIKVISEALIGREETRARFAREAKLMASVEHPNIVRLYSFANRDDLMYLAMEYIEGESLDQLLAREGRLPIARALEVTLAVARALAVAWEKGIIHRDVKPSNILLDVDGGVHVADFGLAKPLLTEGGDLTVTGDLMGTPYYVSPEQVHGQRIDFRSDIYSLGLVFYEMLTGERPFPGASPLVVLSKNMTEDVPLPGERRAEIPVAVDRLAHSMTRRLMSKRPQSASALIRELEQAIGARADSDLTLTDRSTQWRIASGRLLRRLSRNPRRSLTLIATLFLLSTLGAVSAWRWLRSEPRLDSKVNRVTSSPLIVRVVPFDVEVPRGSTPVFGTGFSETLESVLARSARFRVASADDLSRPEEKVDVVVDGRVEVSATESRVTVRVHHRRGQGRIEEVVLAGIDPGDLAVDLGRKLSLLLEAQAESFEDVRGLLPGVNTGSLDAFQELVTALDHREAQNAEGAIAHLKKALAIDPRFAHAYESLAYAYLVLGETDLAKEAIDGAIASLRGVPELEALKIRRRQAQIYGDLEAEHDHLEELVLRDPERAEWHYLLGWFSFTHLRHCEKGLHQFRRAIELSESSNPEYLNHLAFCELACEGPTTAIATFERYRQALPASADPLVGLAQAQWLAGNLAAAEKALEGAELVEPGFHGLLLSRGNLRLRQGRAVEARGLFETQLARSFGRNREEEAQIHVAMTYLDVGDSAAAIQHAQRAIEAGQDELLGLWVLGRAQVLADDLDGARSTISKMEAIFGGQGSSFRRHLLRHVRGEMLLATGDPESAILEFKKAVELYPYERPYYLAELAEAERKSGRPDAAMENLERALTIDPHHPQIHLERGRLFDELGRKAEAEREYRSVLEILAGADSDYWLVVAANRSLTG